MTRILVISDIHANLTALEAVLADAGDFDTVWCLGDLVGYGPDPNECIARVRGLPDLVCLLGNHDAAALGQIDVEGFNAEARLSVFWMQQQLSQESLAFLKQLPEILVINQATLVHGSPRNPVWEYILDPRTALKNFDHFRTDFCFVGHTHLPIIYQLDENQSEINLIMPDLGYPFKMTPRMILNPGSVGQPRDRNPQAAYAIFDPEKPIWESRRVTYDISSVQERILQAGLPMRHALRLTEGW
jgi:predicted phosphodiesterase